jgi:hypothetical protein
MQNTWVWTFVVLALGLPGLAQAESHLSRLELEIAPRCHAGAPLAAQPVSPWIVLHFENSFLSAHQHERTIYLDGHRLELSSGAVAIDGAGVAHIDPAAIHCAWSRDRVVLQFAEGQSATLHELPEGECQNQNEDIPLLDDYLAKSATFRLELSSAEAPPIVLQARDSMPFGTLWECVRAHGERVTTLPAR